MPDNLSRGLQTNSYSFTLNKQMEDSSNVLKLILTCRSLTKMLKPVLNFLL